MPLSHESSKEMQANFHRDHLVKIHLSLLAGAFIVLYWESVRYWVHTWLTNFEYRFGFIVPLLSFYMVWKKRASIAMTPIRPSKSGLLVIIVGILFYVGGQAAYTKTAQQFSFFIVIPGITLYYLGFGMLRRLAVPLVMLVFMTPYADSLYSYMQVFVARTCTQILLLFDAPVCVESTYIHLPNLHVEVISGCIGIRFLTAILPLGLTLAYIHFDTRWKKITLLVFSAILPILANLFRITSMLLLALRGHEGFVAGTLHKTYGYVVFLASLLIFFSFAFFLKRFGAKPSSAKKELMAKQNPLRQSWTKGFSSYANLILVGLMVLLPATLHTRLRSQPTTPLEQSFKSFPLVLGEWNGREIAEDEWHPEIIGATDNLRRLYKDPTGNQIRVFVSYLPKQTQGRELVFHGNKVLPPGFMIIGQEAKTWTIGNPCRSKLKTKFVQLAKGTQKETLLYWYQNTSHFLHNEFMAKACMAMDSLLWNRSNGSVFVLMFGSTSFNGDDQETKLQDFLSVFMNEILKYLPSHG